MRERISMNSHNEYRDSQVLVSRKRIKNREYVFLKLNEFELFIPSKYLVFVNDAIYIQFIVCSELLKIYPMMIEQAQLISALMVQEYKTKKKRLICYEA